MEGIEGFAVEQYQCPMCGLVWEGDNAPANCPQCGALGQTFKPVPRKPEPAAAAADTWAAEHVIGIAKDVDPRVIEGLKANFTGECTEVGMYLAMSRAADREGYPEVAEAYKRIAYEEADHAARFAELLGEMVSASTKENLSVRTMAESGATTGKTELAKLAKELGYDAIHDTVHEMARDEARHGKAFMGLLHRYFH